MNNIHLGSLVLMGNKLVKCFTFFSALTHNWREFKIDLEKVTLYYTHQDNWFPTFSETNFYVSIHSPNSLPEMTQDIQFKPLLPNSYYRISYSQINTQLLGTGYDSNCFEYDIDYKYANFNMRSDCISSCINGFL